MSKVAKHFLGIDPIMHSLSVEFGDIEFSSLEKNLLEEIVGSIISQQLSTKAADTIYKRFLNLFDGKFPTPSKIIATEDEKIRECGISYSKIKYIKGIAEAVENGALDLTKLPSMSDEEVIEELVKLKGIGRWTAEMLLMFSLNREDIFSMGDLGLRNAIAKLYNVDRDDLKAIEKIVEKWKPYRTHASRYLWKSLDKI